MTASHRARSDDVLWYVPEDYKDFDVFDGECGYCEIHVTDVGVRHIYFSSFDPPEDDVNEAIPVKEIGKTIFYTRAEAESAAAERTEHETIEQRSDGACDRGC